MKSDVGLHAVQAFKSAFGVEPDIAAQARVGRGVGIYGWKTPVMEGFELPETDELVIALHLSGSRQVRAVTGEGLSRSRSTPGLVTILPAGRSAGFHTAGGISVATLHVARSRRKTSLLSPLTDMSSPMFAFKDAYVRAGMEALMRAAASDRSQFARYIDKVTDALLTHLAQRVLIAHSARRAERTDTESWMGEPSLVEVVDYIDKHLNAKLSLESLAARAGVSRNTLTAQFKSETGLSIHQYITRSRIEMAKRLLRDSTFDLSYIAQETGFCSQSHFTECFRASTGNTPARFRDETLSQRSASPAANP